MPSTTLIWTTLPAGIRRRKDKWYARMSVFLTPRLEVPPGGELSLAAFPEFIDWPATLRRASADGIGFQLQVCDGRQPLPETVLRPLGAGFQQSSPDSDAWRSIFPETTAVRAFKPPETVLRSAPVQTYPAGEIVAGIREAYSEMLAYELGETIEAPALSEFAVERGLLEKKRGPYSAVEQFLRFHSSGGEAPEKEPLRQSGDDCADFHQIVASAGTHPHLMRRLGLVTDVELPAEKLGLDKPGRDLRLRTVPVDAGLDDAVHFCQWTAVEYDTVATDTFRMFTTAADVGPGPGGFQLQGSGPSGVAQENIEHAVFALVQHKRDVLAERGQLPSLLQGGMRLTHAGSAAALEKAMGEQSQLERRLRQRRLSMPAGVLDCPDDDEPLRAGQLIRGYRVDVRDAVGGRWRSLCRRQVHYRSGAWSWPPDDASVEDEGVIEPAAYVDRNAGDNALRATQDLFEWDGWSLVVPRPDHSDNGGQALPRQCGRGGKPPFTARCTVPAGSLQRQRFGRSYQFRLRAVDLAGNSLSVEEADAFDASRGTDDFVSAPVRCLRVESAKPPVIVRAQPRGPGEAGDIIVLRDAESPKYRTNRFRVHVLPPEVPLRIAEKHGLFDGMSTEDAWRLMRDHRGELVFESATDEKKSDVSSGSVKEPAAEKEIYAPYLADPMVKRAVLLLPDGAGIIDLPAFDELPPEKRGRKLARSCSLVVQPARKGVRAVVTDRQVTIEVPKGRVQEIEIAAKLSQDDLALTAFADRDWHVRPWQRKRYAAVAKKLETAAMLGRPPQVVAPSRTVRIVHATQRPLASPEFGRPLIMPREMSSTSAMLADDALGFDRPSTGRIDIYARWEDPVDDPGDDAWRLTENEMHAGGVRIDPDDGKPLDPVAVDEPSRSPLSHDFGDTKHREVTYRAVAISRFVEFYPRSLTQDPDNVSRSSRPVTLHVPATAPPTPPDVAYVLPTLRRNDAANTAGDALAERSAEQIGEGLRVYLNRGWFSSGKGEKLALVLGAQGTRDPLRRKVSSWGLNPLRDSAPLPGPLGIEHMWGGAERITGWPLEGGPVDLVIYEVNFSGEHGLAFADIEFLSQRAFMPFVRLALARYQAHALAGCKLSRVVSADFVPLAPGRAVTVKRTGRTNWSLTMRGYSYRQADEKTSVVQAHIEYLDRALPEDAVSWRPLGPVVTLSPSTVEPYRYHWSGHLRLEDPKYLSLRWRRRLVIREFEPFAREDSRDVPLADRSRLVSAHAVPI